MVLRGRMTALKLMCRIKQHEMETIGVELSALRAVERALEDQNTQLGKDAVREATDSTEDTRIFLPAYLKSVETRQRGLVDELAAAAEKTAHAEEELFKSFRETKITEQVMGRVARELALEEARATTAEMDDAGRTLFLLERNEQTAD